MVHVDPRDEALCKKTLAALRLSPEIRTDHHDLGRCCRKPARQFRGHLQYGRVPAAAGKRAQANRDPCHPVRGVTMDYGYINARMRGMKSRLLSHRALDDLILKPDLESLIADLENSPYREDIIEAKGQFSRDPLHRDVLSGRISSGPSGRSRTSQSRRGGRAVYHHLPAPLGCPEHQDDPPREEHPCNQ